jgi:hypothetical protein
MIRVNNLSIGLAVCFTLFISTANAQQCYDSANLMTTSKKEFIIHDNGTVSHVPTSLMWKQCLEGLTGDCSVGEKLAISWQQALEQVQNLNSSGGFAGYTDWRLPNPKEAMSILEYGCFRPAINLSVFPNMQDTRVWLSTAAENVASNVSRKSWFANYGEADVGSESGTIDYSNADRQSQTYSVHLVRGAQ